MKNLLILSVIVILSLPTSAQEITEINTVLMNSTFRIEGSGKTGTVFLLMRQSKSEPEFWAYVLVTANHVLDDIKTDYGKLYLRIESNGKYTKFPHDLQVRENGKPLWIKHPEVDIAIMYFEAPQEFTQRVFSCEMLATDEFLDTYEIHPGDELFCLGYPLGLEANDAGFPILRGGLISSYPLIPTKEIKSFLFDFQVFGGNSGGPVYFIGKNRVVANNMLMGQVSCIIGLVSKQVIQTEKVESASEITFKLHQLSLAEVIHATFIREAIELLPDK